MLLRWGLRFQWQYRISCSFGPCLIHGYSRIKRMSDFNPIKRQVKERDFYRSTEIKRPIRKCDRDLDNEGATDRKEGR